jgi:hypothetical protein
MGPNWMSWHLREPTGKLTDTYKPRYVLSSGTMVPIMLLNSQLDSHLATIFLTDRD